MGRNFKTINAYDQTLNKYLYIQQADARAAEGARLLAHQTRELEQTVSAAL